MADDYVYNASDSGPYGNHVPYDRGYGVRLPNVEAGQGRHKDNWNCRMIDPHGKEIKLWVTDYQTDFSLSGETAQSRKTRQFFPHSFTQPTIALAGQMPNNYQYNRLAAFVRHTHAVALNINQFAKDGLTNSSDTVLPLVTLQLRAGGTPAKHNAKGVHRAQQLKGYIKNVSAGGERFNNAPDFLLQFVVAFSSFAPGTTGIYTDTLTTGSQILPWMDIFKNQFQGVSSAQPPGTGLYSGKKRKPTDPPAGPIDAGPFPDIFGGLPDIIGGLK